MSNDDASAFAAAERQLNSRKGAKKGGASQPNVNKRRGNPKPITVLHNYGGRRCPPEGPKEVRDWGVWDCDPSKTGPPSQHHAYGSEFPWTFDMEEKAYVLEGTATLTADDPERHGDPCDICLLYTSPSPRDS
eukprot:TRINITY_DN54513_c0_g1_i1.p1 TRINITY_DN54513_c0_g1~~TRINITY_DN54513_c0_g1_i1.p1  ORF type:complete len:133 (+),score=20.54 TRINITY_DN54513_c0_g1_i1:136-534(+)